MTGESPILDVFRLNGRVAVVTGASSGLGVAIARALAEAGADVALGARRSDRLLDTQRLVEAAGRRAIAVPTDIASVDDCQALVAQTVERLGRVDILINNAGVANVVAALDETPSEFRQVIEVNLMGTFWMCQECARVMPRGSSIVNIASVLAFTTAMPPQAAYASSKSAIVGLTRSLARQWTGPNGIRVNGIAPGFFVTEMTAGADAAVVAAQGPRIPVDGRPGDNHELAAAAVFLAGPGAGYITGQTLIVDGGLTIT